MVFTSSLLALVAAATPAPPTTVLGTGFFYNRQCDFFTNHHLVAQCQPESIQARTFDGVWHPVAILATGRKSDIAAATINHEVPAFASIRVFGQTNSVSVPEPTEDIFSAGFSAPERNKFKLQIKWGQIQPSSNPNVRPFIQRMRMDAFPGAAGSAILDYAGLLVGILFASSREPAPNLSQLRTAGYGDKWIFFYNNNAIVEFANNHKLSYSAWGQWKRQDPMFIASHARRITALVACNSVGRA